MANQYEDIPEVPSDMIYNWSASTHTLQFDGTTLEWQDAECECNPTYPIRCKGILIKSEEHFFMRVWLLLSNPFRYLLTGRIRY
jgi:hypothetical protein